MRRVALLFILSLSLPCNLSALRAAEPLSPFGVGSSAEASGRYPEWMPKMADAGINWVRTFPDWNQLEPAPGKWNWSGMDALLDTAARARLNISALFLYNARWLNGDDHTFPTNNEAWSTYVSNVVRHAAGRVRYWEVWNEPQNFASHSTPADYARIVTHAYNAAKAVDPQARIGLTVASVDILYLERALSAGAANHFDFICVHPYEVLGTIHAGQEALFMNIVPLLRKMLLAQNPEQVSVPIWFTEIGEELSARVTPEIQGQDLVKAYVMSIAQGVSVVQWFEAQEGGYKMGLLDSHGALTPSYTALKNLATKLGPNPTYLGWTLLNGRAYGFVFRGAGNTVLATWAPPHSSESLNLGAQVQVINPVDGSELHGPNIPLSNAPLLVLGVPPKLIADASQNRNHPFPWKGDYSAASEVSITFGSDDLEKGLHTTAPDPSLVATVDGAVARDCSKGASVAFTVDPNFLSYTQEPIKITAVVRSVSATNNPGFNLKYEAKTGRKGRGWNSVPADGKWHTLSWTLDDDEFVGNWGYHFSFDSDSTRYSGYYLREVTVTKLQRTPR